MNFGEAPKYEPDSLEGTLAELGLPVDPRRLIGRLYKFTTKSTENKNGIFIGTIVGLEFEWPSEISFSVSDMNIRRIFAFRTGLSRKMLWVLVHVTPKEIYSWRGEFKLL